MRHLTIERMIVVKLMKIGRINDPLPDKYCSKSHKNAIYGPLAREVAQAASEVR